MQLKIKKATKFTSIFFMSLFMTYKAQAVMPLIYIDAGHTLEHPGVTGACGTQEVWLNDQLSLQLARALQQDGYRVQFSRVPNIDKSKIAPQEGRESKEQLKARTAKANQLKADLFISIHHDSVSESALTVDEKACAGQNVSQPLVISDEFLSKPDIQIGFNIFFTRNTMPQRTANSLKFAKIIGEEFLKRGERPSTYHLPKYEEGCESCKFEDKGLGVMSRTLGVLRDTQMPSVLVEITNLRMESMETQANSPEYQQAVVSSLKTAILRYFQK